MRRDPAHRRLWLWAPLLVTPAPLPRSQDFLPLKGRAGESNFPSSHEREVEGEGRADIHYLSTENAYTVRDM